MTRTLALLLCLVGCATQVPSELHRGAVTAPPPAPARPGVGAPIRGQPGQPHAYPRSPYTRELPPTREPGIWASSDPQSYTLLGFPPLGPDVADEFPEYMGDARSCASMMERAINMADERTRVDALPMAARRCLAARLYLTCLQVAPSLRANATDIVRAAMAEAKNACASVDDAMGRHVDAILRNASAQYSERVRELEDKARRMR